MHRFYIGQIRTVNVLDFVSNRCRLGKMTVGSLSSDVFELRPSTGSGMFALLSRDFEQICANRLLKSKNTSQYKFGSVKGYQKRKRLTDGRRATLLKLPISLKSEIIIISSSPIPKARCNID